MISFENDYSEGVHEEILRRLEEVNKEGITGYGNDEYCVNSNVE
jgi:threonine aldolase